MIIKLADNHSFATTDEKLSTYLREVTTLEDYLKFLNEFPEPVVITSSNETTIFIDHPYSF